MSAPGRWWSGSWLPDRPGALGQVASRIGAVRGDLLAIDILERGGGQVIDELVVSLPDETPQELLVMEIGAVDGVAVEHIRAVPADRPDPVMAMFELGARGRRVCARRRDHDARTRASRGRWTPSGS